MAIVIAAHDEGDRIAATLAALAHAFPGAPVWVADDGSSDATAQIASENGAHVVRSERVIGKGGAMSEAARAALTQAAESHDVNRDKSIFLLCDGDLADSARELGALVDTVACGGGQGRTRHRQPRSHGSGATHRCR